MEKACLSCGNKYHVKPSQAEKSKYCSRRCQTISTNMHAEKNPNFKGARFKCFHCGTMFANPVRKKCCSDICVAAYRRENPVYRFPTNRPAEPKRILKESICQLCGAAVLKLFHVKTCGPVCQAKLMSSLVKGIPRPKAVPYKMKNCLHCGGEYKNYAKKSKYCSYACHIASGGAFRAGMAAQMMKKKYGAKKDANHSEVVKALEKCGAKVLDLSMLGGGIPDICVWCGFAWHMVEIKNKNTAYGRRGLNKNQIRWEKMAGSKVHIVYTQEEAIGLLNRWRSGREPNPFVVHAISTVDEAVALVTK